MRSNYISMCVRLYMFRLLRTVFRRHINFCLLKITLGGVNEIILIVLNTECEEKPSCRSGASEAHIGLRTDTQAFHKQSFPLQERWRSGNSSVTWHRSLFRHCNIVSYVSEIGSCPTCHNVYLRAKINCMYTSMAQTLFLHSACFLNSYWINTMLN